jgi:hypothetical protein
MSGPRLGALSNNRWSGVSHLYQYMSNFTLNRYIQHYITDVQNLDLSNHPKIHLFDPINHAKRYCIAKNQQLMNWPVWFPTDNWEELMSLEHSIRPKVLALHPLHNRRAPPIKSPSSLLLFPSARKSAEMGRLNEVIFPELLPRPRQMCKRKLTQR